MDLHALGMSSNFTEVHFKLEDSRGNFQVIKVLVDSIVHKHIICGIHSIENAIAKSHFGLSARLYSVATRAAT